MSEATKVDARSGKRLTYIRELLLQIYIKNISCSDQVKTDSNPLKDTNSKPELVNVDGWYSAEKKGNQENKEESIQPSLSVESTLAETGNLVDDIDWDEEVFENKEIKTEPVIITTYIEVSTNLKKSCRVIIPEKSNRKRIMVYEEEDDD